MHLLRLFQCICLTKCILFIEGSCDSEVISGSLKVKVDGFDQDYYVIDPNKGYAGKVKVKDTTVTLGHGPRIYIGNKCESSMKSGMFWHPNLKKSSLSFTVDLSGIGCGCNGALYLVNMPASSKTSCGDYHCDANYVCGEGCSEFDIIEANNEACRVTAHKCDSTGCDGGGCGFQISDFGPSKKINTNKKFKGIVEFNDNSITTTIKQSGNEYVVIQNDDTCGQDYVETMAKDWNHMVLTASSWGDSGESMSWLDGETCDTSISCNNGEWSFSDLHFNSNQHYTIWEEISLWFQSDHPIWFIKRLIKNQPSSSNEINTQTMLQNNKTRTRGGRGGGGGGGGGGQSQAGNSQPSRPGRKPMFSRRDQNGYAYQQNGSRNQKPRDPLKTRLLDTKS